MPPEKSIIANKVTLIKKGLSGYAVLKRFKMIGSEINHCRVKIKILKNLRKEYQS